MTFLLPSSLAYDPLTWLVWGREVLADDVRAATGPSWKPLTVALAGSLSRFGDAVDELRLSLADGGLGRARRGGTTLPATGQCGGSHLRGASDGRHVAMAAGPPGPLRGLPDAAVLLAIESHLAVGLRRPSPYPSRLALEAGGLALPARLRSSCPAYGCCPSYGAPEASGVRLPVPNRRVPETRRWPLVRCSPSSRTQRG